MPSGCSGCTSRRWPRTGFGLRAWARALPRGQPQRRLTARLLYDDQMKNTITVKRQYMHYQTKYNRFEKRCSSTSAHCSPALRVKEGDQVTIGQCR